MRCGPVNTIVANGYTWILGICRTVWIGSICHPKTITMPAVLEIEYFGMYILSVAQIIHDTEHTT